MQYLLIKNKTKQNAMQLSLSQNSHKRNGVCAYIRQRQERIYFFLFFGKQLLLYSAFHLVLNTNYFYKGKICIHCK